MLKWISTPISLSWKSSWGFVGRAILLPSMGEMRYFGVEVGEEVIERAWRAKRRVRGSFIVIASGGFVPTNWVF